jgi:beta-lactamase class D
MNLTTCLEERNSLEPMGGKGRPPLVQFSFRRKGKKMKLIHAIFNLITIAILLLFIKVYSYAEDPDLAKLFQSRGVEGTFIIDSLDSKETYVYNEARSEERFSPASTFKILNTLIALEEGAIKNEKEVIKWDGKDRGLDAWNKDQTLETAFPISCVWFYQELARRIGIEKCSKRELL